MRPAVLLFLLTGCAGQSDDRAVMADQQIKILTSSVRTFRAKYGDWPDTLKQLTAPDESGVPLLIPELLTDPWGRPYVYEKGNQSSTGIPLIWSHGPNPNDLKGRLRNW